MKSLTLFHRALILVSVPLILQIIFVGVLFFLLQQAEIEKEHEQYLKKVMGRFGLLKDSFVESLKIVGPSILTGKHDVASRYHQAIDPIPGELKELQDALRDNEKAQDILDSLAPKLEFTISVLDKTTQRLSEGNRLGAVLEIRKLKDIYMEVLQELDTLEGYIESIDQEFPKKQERTREITLNVLYGGIAFTVLLALILAWHFNKGATKRLAVLVDNTARMAQDADLLPPVGGHDEITALDETFREMTNALRLSYETEQKILESIPVGLAFTDKEGQIQKVNAATCKMFGYTTDELQSKSLTKLLAADTIDLHSESALASPHTLELETLSREGRGLTVLVNQKAIHTNRGDRLLFILQDVTERKEVDRFKQEFLSMVSHDLRTPLTSIRFFIEMLESGSFSRIDEEQSARTRNANTQIDKLIKLINDVLDIEKLESGSFVLVCRPISVSTFLDEALETVRNFAASKDVRIELEIENDVKLQGDKDRLARVTINVLDNAIRLSPFGTSVLVQVEERPSTVVISVRDNGPGIPSGLKDSLFDHYKPVAAQNLQDQGGTGLGLALSKALILKHGGTIGVRSEDGNGSTFWFELPTINRVL